MRYTLYIVFEKYLPWSLGGLNVELRMLSYFYWYLVAFSLSFLEIMFSSNCVRWFFFFFELLLCTHDFEP